MINFLVKQGMDNGLMMIATVTVKSKLLLIKKKKMELRFLLM